MPRKTPRRSPNLDLLRDASSALGRIGATLDALLEVAQRLVTPAETTALAASPYVELGAGDLSAEHVGAPVFVDDPDGGFEDLRGNSVPFVTGTAGTLVGFTRVPGRPASMEPTRPGQPVPLSTQPRVKVRLDVGAGTIVSLEVPMRALVRVNTRKA